MTRNFTCAGTQLLLVALLLTGCTINRDIMFKTAKDYTFDQVTDSVKANLKLQRNDQLLLRLYANDGFKLIDMVNEGGARDAAILQRASFTYFIDADGLVKLPLLGRVPMAGLTLREAEAFLEEKYTAFYKRPYAQVIVNNRRVVVFPGGGGDAKVVQLENTNTSLLEVIGLAGGLNKRGNAHKVKVFRYDTSGKRLIYQFDLSDISGLQYADMVMQGDDVVYVQPNPDIASEALQDILPIVTLLSSVLLVLSVTRNLK